MKRLTALLLCLSLVCGYGYGQQKISDGSRDHGAARLDLSNVPDDSVVTRHVAPQEFLDFVRDAEPPAYAEGRLFWHKDNGCPAFYPDMSGPIMQVGQEFWVRVKNPGVATMTNGSVVCLNEPDTGNDPVAVLADAASIDTAKIIGVVTADISPDSSGYATIFGLVRDINTAGFTPGARVFLAAGSPGTFTETVPAAPNYSVVVGYVMKAHATAGSIYVRPWINGALDRAQYAGDVGVLGTLDCASFTVGGVDVLGDIDAALTSILGE